MDNQGYYIRYGALSYELDQEHTDHGLTDTEMRLLTECLDGVRNAVHLCCGAGRHVAAFENVGIASCGIDISPELIQKGRESVIPRQPTGQGPRLVLGDVVSLPFKARTTDCVTLLGNSLCLFPEHLCAEILAEVARILVSEGLFIIDLPDPAYLQAHQKGTTSTSQTIHTQTLGVVQWTWVRHAYPERCMMVSEEYVQPLRDEKPLTKTLRFEFHLYEPQKACVMSETFGLHLERVLECEDLSGRYKGMLRKRNFLLLRSTKDGSPRDTVP
ncbi:MAG: class I SAM-dependent methyltransferase [Desulfobacteraceae bacterium]|jgi:SAM-dependent methyltransferase